MPVKLICGCGSETIYNRSSLQGIDWIYAGAIGGGVRIICPKCQTVSNKDYEDYLIEGEIISLIEIYVEQARQEAVEKYTYDYVKKLRREREEKFISHIGNNFIGGVPQIKKV